ncbi:MAG: 50S ribosomal protein L18 [Planctomycetes bacterium]|nr:50S ribosomal protein L18 [Planctomycetota bacterium]
MNHQKFKNTRRLKRKRRVRKNVSGDSERPRLSVFRSLRHIYAQIIDDDNGVTVVSASTLSKDVADREKTGGNKDAASLVGEDLARKAIALGIRQVRFDRNGYKYHGRIRVLAESARKTGLVF